MSLRTSTSSFEHFHHKTQSYRELKSKPWKTQSNINLYALTVVSYKFLATLGAECLTSQPKVQILIICMHKDNILKG